MLAQFRTIPTLTRASAARVVHSAIGVRNRWNCVIRSGCLLTIITWVGVFGSATIAVLVITVVVVLVSTITFLFASGPVTAATLAAVLFLLFFLLPFLTLLSIFVMVVVVMVFMRPPRTSASRLFASVLSILVLVLPENLVQSVVLVAQRPNLPTQLFVLSPQLPNVRLSWKGT